MAIQNTFSRDASGLTRQAPTGYRKIDGNIYNAPIQGGGYYSGPETGAPQLDMSTVQSASGGSSPMLPSGNQPVAGDPMDSFNKLSLGLLNSAKGLTTADLLKKRRLLERASIDRSSTITPEDERVLSPGQQSAIRGGRTAALSSEIDQNKYEIEKAQQSIDNFFKVFGEAQKISKDWADKAVAPESVIKNAQMIIQADPDKMATVLASFNDKSKSAVLEGLDYSKLTKDKTTDVSGTVVEVGGKKLLINPKTGQTIKDLGSATGTVTDENQKYELKKGLSSANDVIKDLEKGEQGDLANAFGVLEQWKPESMLTGNTAYLYNKLVQLRQSIVLALRAKLKGQGTITDQETAMLEKASTAISRNLDIEDVKTEVEEMKNFIQFQLSGDSGGDNDPLGIR